MPYDLWLRNGKNSLSRMSDGANVMHLYSGQAYFGNNSGWPGTLGREQSATYFGEPFNASLFAQSGASSKHYSGFGAITNHIWHSHYVLDGNPWISPHFGLRGAAPGNGCVYNPNDGNIYATHQPNGYYPTGQVTLGEVYGGGFAPPINLKYGLRLNNVCVIGGRRIMRLLTWGTTNHHRDGIHSFYFHCNHRDFAVYFLPMEEGVATCSHAIRDVGNGVYEAFFLGSSCRVFVYERKTARLNNRYGLIIRNENIEVAFEEGDIAMKAMNNIYIPGLRNNAYLDLFPWTENRAVNMHCNRYAVNADIYAKSVYIYRDYVMRINGQLRYGFNLANVIGTNEINKDYFYINPRQIRPNTMIMNVYSTSVGVVDTSNVY